MSGKTVRKVLCDLCYRIVYSRDALIMPVKIGDQLATLTICLRCVERSLEAPKKYVRKSFKEGGSGPEDLEEVASSISRVRTLLFKPEKAALKHPLSIEEIRSRAIDEILEAMVVIEGLAENAPIEAEKGKADTTKARYYSVLGYLVQVLDGILKSVESNDLDNRLKAVEAFLNELAKATVKKG
ncbi:MAG: hypothetical protein ACUVTM_06405 [Candidatus Bathyarchaeia archaeon]